MAYDLKYHKNLDKSHILPNILNGAYMGVFSQFLSDFFLSVLLYNNTIIINDIKISSITNYYASALTGMLAGLLIIYIDPIGTIAITTIFYNYADRFMHQLINNEDLNLKPIEYTFDASISVLLIALFDPTAKSQFYRYQQKRNFIEPTIPRTDRTLGLVIFFSILTSTYGFLKLDNPIEEKNSTLETC